MEIVHFQQVLICKGVYWCYSHVAGERTKRVRAMKSHWITLKLKAIPSKNSNHWLKSKKCRNAVNTEIKQTKEEDDKNALQDNELDPRKTYKSLMN